MNTVLGSLAVLSVALLLWQWLAGVRFPLHRRSREGSFSPGVSLLKPLKGAESATRECLRSWLAQNYQGPFEILFAVAQAEDPVCLVVKDLLREFPSVDARLIVCESLSGANLKVSKLIQLERLARHEFLVISDADVRVPGDLLHELVQPLRDPQAGLVNCLYRLANPRGVAMDWEAVAVNADFWSQVLQSRSLKQLDFALGAVMAVSREALRNAGGFEVLADCLADDYQLGNRIAKTGRRIVLSPVVVECWSDPMSLGQVWAHQLRWARTIRVCQPLPYFFSILSNATLWPALWLLVYPSTLTATFAGVCVLVRLLTAWDLHRRLAQAPPSAKILWVPILKDLLQTLLWILAFCGNKIVWRGRVMRLRRDGTMAEA